MHRVSVYGIVDVVVRAGSELSPGRGARFLWQITLFKDLNCFISETKSTFSVSIHAPLPE